MVKSMAADLSGRKATSHQQLKGVLPFTLFCSASRGAIPFSYGNMYQNKLLPPDIMGNN